MKRTLSVATSTRTFGREGAQQPHQRGGDLRRLPLAHGHGREAVRAAVRRDEAEEPTNPRRERELVEKARGIEAADVAGVEGGVAQFGAGRHAQLAERVAAAGVVDGARVDDAAAARRVLVHLRDAEHGAERGGRGAGLERDDGAGGLHRADVGHRQARPRGRAAADVRVACGVDTPADGVQPLGAWLGLGDRKRSDGVVVDRTAHGLAMKGEGGERRSGQPDLPITRRVGRRPCTQAVIPATSTIASLSARPTIAPQPR